MSFTVAVAGLGSVVAVLAGCSSSSSKTTTSTAAGSLSSSSRTAAASPSASPASAAQLAKIVLQPGDFPQGWEPKPYEPDPNASAADAEFHKCLGVPSSDADQVAEANSDDFDQGDAEISSAAYSFRSQSAVDADVAGLHSAKAAPCLEQEMTKLFASGGLPAGATLESVSFKITPGSAGGPANVVATGAGTFKVSGSGLSVTGYLNVAFITGPLIEADVTSDNIGAPVPTSVMDPLVAAVADRAAQGGGAGKGVPTGGNPATGSTTPPNGLDTPPPSEFRQASPRRLHRPRSSKVCRRRRRARRTVPSAARPRGHCSTRSRDGTMAGRRGDRGALDQNLHIGVRDLCRDSVRPIALRHHLVPADKGDVGGRRPRGPVRCRGFARQDNGHAARRAELRPGGSPGSP